MLRRNLRLKTWLLVGLALLVIVAGTLVGAVRLLDRTVPGYRAQTADRISERLGQPLEIGAMGLGWTWTGPVLRFSDVALLDEEGEHTVLDLRELGLHFAFWDLLRGVRRPDGLALAGVEITLHREENGTWRLHGLGDNGKAETLTAADIDRWLDRMHRVRLEDGRLRITDAAHPAVDMTVTAVAGTLRNKGPRHRARVEARLPPDLGGQMELDVFVLGKLARIDDLEAHVYARFEDLAGANLLRTAGLGDDNLSGGSGELEVWSEWRQGRLDGARASLELDALRLGGDEGDSTALQPPLTVDISLQPPEPDGGYRVQLDALRTGRAGTLPTTATLTLQPEAGRAEGRLRELPVPLAAAWAKLAAPERLADTSADGMLDELRGHYAGRDDWRLAGAFTDLSLRDAEGGLDAGRFDGTWALGNDGGELHITKGGGSIAVDRYLRGRLSLSAVNGRIVWENTAASRRVTVHDLRVAAAGTEVTGGGELRLPAGGPAVADMTFEVVSDDLPALFAHIPQAEDLPNPRLREWLSKAVRAGRLTAGKVRLAGPLDRFPLAGDAGEFRVTAEAEGVTLAYKPGWPTLTDVTGAMTLNGDDLDIRARRGRILGVAVGPARAHVADIREPVLKVDGEVGGGDAQHMLGFLTESPLADRFGRLTGVLSLDGEADLSLALSIPLKPELGEMTASGTVHVDGLRASHAALPEPLTDVRGDLRFNLDGLYADDLHATLAGLPLTASLAPVGAGALAIDAETTIRLPEHASALDVFQVPERVVRAAEGESRWRIGLEIGGGGRVSDLSLSSDLAGLNLDLPAPLGKPAAAEVATRLTVAADRDRLHLDYGERLDLNLTFDDDGLHGATAIFGEADVSSSQGPPEGPGWWLGGKVDRLDTGAWRRFLDPGDRADDFAGLRGADLNIGELRVAGQRLREIELRVVPLLTDKGWRARLDGTDAHGTLFWLQNPDRDRIQVRLARLRLTPAPRTAGDGDTADNDDKDDKGEPTDPASLPLLDIAVDSLALAGRDFGRLELRTTAVDGGLALTRLAVSGGVTDLQASGEWRRMDGLTEADFDGRLRGAGIAPLMQALGYTANISADEAKVDTRLRIAPNPDGLTPASLNGKLSLSLKDGRLLAVEPGAGRVLGLVNFYALPRRLLLDFRDVLGKGTSYDRLKGDFRIESGDAYTDNLAIDTPSAEIRIKGRVGLAARDYDQRVTITPQMSGAATMAGTVLGGPAVGAAVWAAQQLLDRPLGELTRVSYHLTGSWDDPQIEEPTADE